jgi:hypothetical protein
MLVAGTPSLIETSALFHEKLFGLQSSSPENGFLTHQNTAGLTMEYPSEWEKVELGGQYQGYVGFRPIEGSAVFIVGAKNVDIPPEFWDNKDNLGITLSEKKGND